MRTTDRWGRTAAAVVGLAVLLGLVAACGSGASATVTTAPAAAAVTTASSPGPSSQPGPAKTAVAVPDGKGEILGNVVRSGRDTRSGSGHGGSPSGRTPVAGDPIEARDSTGKVLAKTVSNSDGQFEFALPAGEYVVVEGIQGASQGVGVAEGVVTTMTLVVYGA